MLSKTIFALAGLVAAAQAIMVLTPKNNSDVDFTQPFDVTWTSVNTDQSTFELLLVNQADVNDPITVSSSVQTSQGKFTVSGLSGVVQNAVYRFNFMSTDPQNTGILAQSQMFHAAKVGSASSSSSSSSSSSATGTSTSAATPTSSSTASTTPTGSGAASATGGASGGNGTAGSSAPPPGSGAGSLKPAALVGGLLAGLVMLL